MTNDVIMLRYLLSIKRMPEHQAHNTGAELNPGLFYDNPDSKLCGTREREVTLNPTYPLSWQS